MDHERPGPDEPFDDDIYAAAWWAWSAYARAGRTGDAAALDWADTGIREQLRHDDPESCVSLIDHLLDAPGADPARLGRGPLQELLEARGPEVADRIAVFAALYPDWRAALAQVRLEPHQAAAVPAVRGWLRGAVPSWQTRPAADGQCRHCRTGTYLGKSRRVRYENGLYSDVDYVRCDACHDEPSLGGYPP